MIFSTNFYNFRPKIKMYLDYIKLTIKLEILKNYLKRAIERNLQQSHQDTTFFFNYFNFGEQGARFYKN